LDRLGDARVLNLHRDFATVTEGRTVDLADRRGRDRLGVEVGEGRGERLAQVALGDLANRLERDRLG
jgi:hypothetical protein